MKIELNGVPLMGTQPSPDMIVYTLSDGESLPVVQPPVGEDGPTLAVQEMFATVNGVANALSSLEGTRVKAANNPKLTEIGRTDAISGVRTAAQDVGQAAMAKLSEAEERVRSWTVELYSPPALADTDVVGGLIDQEIRAHARSLKGEALTKFAQSVATSERHLQAILRSPVPLDPIVSNAAREGWVAHVDRINPATRKLAELKEAVQWGRNVLPALTKHL